MITGVTCGAVETLEGLLDQMKTDLDFRLKLDSVTSSSMAENRFISLASIASSVKWG